MVVFECVTVASEGCRCLEGCCEEVLRGRVFHQGYGGFCDACVSATVHMQGKKGMGGVEWFWLCNLCSSQAHLNTKVVYSVLFCRLCVRCHYFYQFGKTERAVTCLVWLVGIHTVRPRACPCLLLLLCAQCAHSWERMCSGCYRAWCSSWSFGSKQSWRTNARWVFSRVSKTVKTSGAHGKARNSALLWSWAFGQLEPVGFRALELI